MPGTAMKTKDIVITGLLIALVFVATKFINIRLPISTNGGLVHTGNVMLFAASIVFGANRGAAAGAFGMGLFDIVSGWTTWAPFTFVVRGIMGFIIGGIANAHGKNGNNVLYNIVGIVLGSIWMLIGYYLTEVILYGNWYSPVNSIPGNLTQLAIGLILGLPLAIALKKSKIV
ncbi:MAG: ECF transporter S component [Clostridia bacterium]|nr:ECF transporter S component [Clostridia bacterium]